MLSIDLCTSVSGLYKDSSSISTSSSGVTSPLAMAACFSFHSDTFSTMTETETQTFDMKLSSIINVSSNLKKDDNNKHW